RSAAISAAAMLTELRTRQLGGALRVFSETTSTIDVAKQWLSEGAPDGAVVMAERQTHGRGRRGRSWASPMGGLWLTIIRHLDLDPDSVGFLGIALAVAAADTIHTEMDCEVDLKWPNDLMFGHRKVGGVLVESKLNGPRVEAALLSLGLNVNIPETAFPVELKGSATSLLTATGQVVPLPRLAARLIESVENVLQAVCDDPEAILQVWRARDMLQGRKVILEVAGNTVRGQARGIDRQGRLLLRTSLFGRRVVASGEVLSVSEVKT
ncbi:MAG: biotin--[acetyl-CoA-carboxylase] ligase, partial [Armatimonadetes bacterium]|nr:biotin--[acetyl-CoA-carboxylase] ligase [Armatimonadota bacterium]